MKLSRKFVERPTQFSPLRLHCQKPFSRNLFSAAVIIQIASNYYAFGVFVSAAKLGEKETKSFSMQIAKDIRIFHVTEQIRSQFSIGHQLIFCQINMIFKRQSRALVSITNSNWKVATYHPLVGESWLWRKKFGKDQFDSCLLNKADSPAHIVERISDKWIIQGRISNRHSRLAVSDQFQFRPTGDEVGSFQVRQCRFGNVSRLLVALAAFSVAALDRISSSLWSSAASRNPAVSRNSPAVFHARRPVKRAISRSVSLISKKSAIHFQIACFSSSLASWPSCTT